MSRWDAHLEPGERVVWEGRPRTGFLVGDGLDPQRVGAFLCGPGLAVLVGALIFVPGTSGQDVIGVIVMAPFFAGVFYLVFWVDFDDRRRTRYALSNQRVLFLIERDRPLVSWVALDQDTEAVVDGVGTLILRRKGWQQDVNQCWIAPLNSLWPGAYDVEGEQREIAFASLGLAGPILQHVRRAQAAI